MSVARVAPLLPAVRGRTRVFLELYKLLKLQKEHLISRARLRLPLPYRAELDLHSWSQRIAFLTGGYEPDTTRFLDRLYRSEPGDGYLLDVGANVGLIAIPFAKLSNGPLPRVIAVEAVPDNARALRRNVAMNALDDAIRIEATALGEASGRASIEVEGDLAAGEGTGTANIVPESYGGVRQEILVETVDSLELPAGCKVIKIDTDGYDLKVLMGARAFLARERPVIYGEFAEHCLHWHEQSVADVISFAADNGYLTWQRRLRSWTFSSEVNRATYVMDLLLVPREREASYAKFLSS